MSGPGSARLVQRAEMSGPDQAMGRDVWTRPATPVSAWAEMPGPAQPTGIAAGRDVWTHACLPRSQRGGMFLQSLPAVIPQRAEMSGQSCPLPRSQRAQRCSYNPAQPRSERAEMSGPCRPTSITLGRGVWTRPARLDHLGQRCLDQVTRLDPRGQICLDNPAQPQSQD